MDRILWQSIRWTGFVALVGPTNRGAVGDLAFGPGPQWQTSTNSSGAYSFTNIPPGSYQVSEAQQFGYVQTFPSLLADGEETHTIKLQSGTTLAVNDLGLPLDFGKHSTWVDHGREVS